MSDWHPDRLYSEHRDRECKYCGEGWLHWEQDDYGRWVLMNDAGDRHECDEYYDEGEI